MLFETTKESKMFSSLIYTEDVELGVDQKLLNVKKQTAIGKKSK